MHLVPTQIHSVASTLPPNARPSLHTVRSVETIDPYTAAAACSPVARARVACIFMTRGLWTCVLFMVHVACRANTAEPIQMLQGALVWPSNMHV